MAPEMLEPPLEGATPPVGYSGDKVDVYSLGIVLWELMEWRIPWTGANISKQEVIDSVVGRNERLPLPSSCDKRLADVISAMWAASPVDRPDMGSVVKTFEAVGSKWDDAGNFAKVANRAAGEGEALARALSKYNAEQGNPLKEEDVGESSVEEAEAQAAEPEEAPATRAPSGTDASDAAAAAEAAAAAAASGPAEPPRNWFGEVGAVDVEEVRAKLVPMLYPHMFASVTSDADTKRLDEQKTELRELQSKAVDLRARSKLDPFAAFTADAKGREAKRLDKTISLAAAESEVHAWRATRDLLREQLAEAEKQHLDWRRKYREIERKR
jgi:serine/threonine protein kinase